MSKRHGAVGPEAYRNMGFLPEAMQNYLLRLGWGHGDDEIIPRDKAVEWFDLSGVGRSPARFDLDKLIALNLHYMKVADDKRLTELTAPFVAAELGRELSIEDIALLARAMPSMKERAKTLVELGANALFLFRERPLAFDAKATKVLSPEAIEHLSALRPLLAEVQAWDAETLEALVRAAAEAREVGLGKLAQPLRAALTGGTVSPPIFDVLDVFGRDECLARLDEAIAAFG